MVKGWDYMRGMPPGGTLVINTHYSPEYMLRFVPGAERLAQLVCVDAARLAHHKWLYYRLGELGLDRLSTEGAADSWTRKDATSSIRFLRPPAHSNCL